MKLENRWLRFSNMKVTEWQSGSWDPSGDRSVQILQKKNPFTHAQVNVHPSLPCLLVA